MPRRFLRAEWRHLVMLNYKIDPEVLRPLVPHGTELDTWNGQCLASMVGFRFLRTRVLGVPIPFHRNFDEVNLRYYVRRHGPDGWRRGVVFVKEIVPRWAIAFVARWVYNENYVALPMKSTLEVPAESGPGRMEFAWKSGGQWSRLSANVAGQPTSLVAGSEEEFITEHYWGYVPQRDGSSLEYRVEHPPWRVWRATASSFDCDVATMYGPQFVSAFAKPPSSAFVAEGSEVAVYRGEGIDRPTPSSRTNS